MKASPQSLRRLQRSHVVAAMLLFNLALTILQLWLFVGVLESLIAGRTAAAIPASLLSLGILGVNVWMLKGIYRMEESG